jgi:tetratricopeptide (TPR) repeat protein
VYQRRRILESVVKVVTAIGWPQALLILGIVFCIAFHKDISDLIRRIVKVKAGNAGVEAAPRLSDSPAPVPPATQTAELPAKDTTSASGNDEGKTPEVSDRLFGAFEARDLDAMEQLRGEYVDSGKNDEEKTGNDLFYLALRSVAGDAEAMKELKRLGDSGSHSASQARRLTAFALSMMEQPALAQDAYRNALAVAETDKQKSQATIGLAGEIEKSGQWEEATRILVDALAHISETAARVRLLDALAETASRHKQNSLAVIALEESVTLNPGSTDSLFRLGYYSNEAGLPELSAAAYKQLLAITPKNENGLNNLGVDLDRLKLPALAVQHFEEASKLGSTLADANLAKSLIDAGFLSEARDRLTTAAREKEAHEDVHSTLARIDPQQKAEEERFQKALEKARRSADQLVKFSQHLFSSHTGEIGGNWLEPGGTPFQLQVIDGSIVGKCTVDKHQWSIAGKADFAGGGHVHATQTDGYAHPELEGYISLEPDGSALQLVLSDGKGELTFWRFSRVSPTTT